MMAEGWFDETKEELICETEGQFIAFTRTGVGAFICHGGHEHESESADRAIVYVGGRVGFVCE